MCVNKEKCFYECWVESFEKIFLRELLIEKMVMELGVVEIMKGLRKL